MGHRRTSVQNPCDRIFARLPVGVVAFCFASLLSAGEMSQSHADGAPIGEGGHNLEAPAEVHSNAGMGQPRADELQRQIELARAQLEAARSEALAAQALADKERNSAERERIVNETLQRGLHILRQDLAKLKAAVADEGDLRRELMAARQELLAREANAGAAESQRRQQTLRSEGLARELTLARRELAQMRKTATASMSADVLAETRQALEDERSKVAALKRELAKAHGAIELVDSKRQDGCGCAVRIIARPTVRRGCGEASGRGPRPRARKNNLSRSRS